MFSREKEEKARLEKRIAALTSQVIRGGTGTGESAFLIVIDLLNCERIFLTWIK